jgi:hypothetical protein
VTVTAPVWLADWSDGEDADFRAAFAGPVDLWRELAG